LSYCLVISRRAQKSITNLQVAEQDRIEKAITSLAENSRPPGSVKLKGSEDRRIRVDNYRVVYGVRDEEQIVEVLNVGHRRDVYRRGWKCNASRQRSTA
jgi:mRNA interferase RelE/StbE